MVEQHTWPWFWQRWKIAILSTPILALAYVAIASMARPLVRSGTGFVVSMALGTLVVGGALALFWRTTAVAQIDSTGTPVGGVEDGSGTAQFALLIAELLLSRAGLVYSIWTYIIVFVVVSALSMLIFDIASGGKIAGRSRVARPTQPR